MNAHELSVTAMKAAPMNTSERNTISYALTAARRLVEAGSARRMANDPDGARLQFTQAGYAHVEIARLHTAIAGRIHGASPKATDAALKHLAAGTAHMDAATIAHAAAKANKR